MADQEIFIPGQNQAQTQPQAEQQPIVQSSPQPESLVQNESQDSQIREGNFFSGGNLVKLLIGFFAILVIAFVLFVLVLPNIGKGSQKVTLSYWGVSEDQSVMQPIISDFEKENPNINVEYTKQDTKDYQEKLLTRNQQGTGPDIFSFQNNWYPKVSQFLLPLPTDVISKDKFDSSFYPVAKKDLIKNGAIYGIPLSIDTLSLFVNTDLFKKAGLNTPKNWNDFAEDARSLTVKDANGKIKTSGAALGTFSNVDHAADIISMLFIQDGVDLNNISGSRDRVSDALRFYSQFAQGDSGVWNDTLDSSLLAFTKGNLAMYFGYYWDYFAIKNQAPNLSFEVNRVPYLNSQNQTIANYWAEGVSSKTKNQKEALLFIKYLSESQTQDKLYSLESKVRAYGEPPAIKSLSGRFQSTPLAAISNQAENAQSSYFSGIPLDKDLSAALSSSVNSILSGTDPGSAADTLISGVSQFFAPPKQ